MKTSMQPKPKLRAEKNAANETESSMAQQAATWLFRSRGRIATVVMVALSLFIAYFVVFDKDGLASYEQKKHQALALQQQIDALQQQNQQMATHNQRLKNDPDTIEHEAREQLHYTRSGEVIYTLPEAPRSDPATQKPAK